jgi:transcriptional regulator with XRE-family HTH domain
MAVSFSEWLLSEIRERGISQSELARRSGVTRTAISDVVTGRRNPGKELANGIATALSLPPEQVFRAAGILPPAAEVDAEVERIIHEASKLGDQDKAEVLAFIRMKINLRKKNG